MLSTTGLSRSSNSTILAHLRTLRASLEQARDALMHFKSDRVDRDKLEPAARRVDDLMNMFTSHARDRDPKQGIAWINEIAAGVEQITNPKATAALNAARGDIASLLKLTGGDAKPTPGGVGAEGHKVQTPDFNAFKQ